MTNLNVRVYKSIDEIDPAAWDRVVAGRGFQSHKWYQFVERAMSECAPTYLIAWDEETPVAGAALFRVHNEPLPLPKVARRFMASILKQRPLLVCRSPLADTSALLLPGEPLRDVGDLLRAQCRADQPAYARRQGRRVRSGGERHRTAGGGSGDRGRGAGG